MLSVVDLLEAGTLAPRLAAYLLAAVGKGASFLVGAVPGGAGKTTVMGALLNFVPASVALRPADGPEAIRQGLRTPAPPACYICHEIGDGPYYAYLWGDDLRRYFMLPGAGHMLATNLHADTFSQARHQICGQNGVPAAALRKMNLMLFLEVRGAFGRAARRIVSAWESDGAAEHVCLFQAGRPGPGNGCSRLVSEAEIATARGQLDAILDSGARTIEDVRTRLLQQRKD